MISTFIKFGIEHTFWLGRVIQVEQLQRFKIIDSIEEIEKSWERIGKFTDNLAQYGMIDEDDC